MTAFTLLKDWDSLDKLEDNDWVELSALIERDLFSASSTRSTVEKVRKYSAGLHGNLLNMAMEAAIRDHWKGLYRYFLVLIADGRPQHVVTG